MRYVDRNLVIASLAALVVRLIFAFAVHAPTDTGEMAAYNALAVSGVFPASTPPLYPLFLRAIYLLFGNREFTAVYVVQGFVSCLGVVALFHWALLFFDRSVATVAAAITAVYPNFMLYNAAVLPESFGVTLIASIMAVSLSPGRTGLKSGISAALTGCGLLMSPAYLFFIPGLIATSRRRWIFIAVLVVTLAPWIIRNALVYDILVPVYDRHTYGISFDVYERARDAWDILARYYYSASVFLGKGWQSYTMDGTFSTISRASHVRTFSYAVLALLGIAGAIRYHRREHRSFLLPFIGYVALFSILAPLDGRHRAVLEPLLVLYAAVLLVYEYRAIRARYDPVHTVIERLRGSWIPLAIIFIVALAIRVYCACACGVDPDFSDMAEYNALAVHGGFDTYRVPLYPLFLRAVYSLFGDYNYTAVFVIQGIIGAFTSLLLYAVAAGMWNRRAGLIAALIFAVYPHFILYNLTTLSETLGVFCVAAIMLVASKDIPNTCKAVALAAVTGTGVLLKPALLFLVPGLFATVRRRWLFVIVLAAVISPWTVRNAVMFRRFVPVSETGAFNFYLSYNEKADGTTGKAPDVQRPVHGPGATSRELPPRPSGSQMEYLQRALRFIAYNRLKTAQIIYNKVSVLFMRGWESHLMGGWEIERVRNLSNVMAYAYVPLAFLGFFGLARYYRREHRPVVAPVAGYVLLVILLSIFKFRFRLLMEPMLVVYASAFLSSVLTLSFIPSGPQRARNSCRPNESWRG
ncbi:MAG TPA: glycosyltransferase family 39 protein [Patescibacteria group bacterium]|nr:glycosyltransferase family 39 protein [Patescibacteria group bacterium]